MTNKVLELVPVKSSKVSWCCNENGMVTLKIKNTGIVNTICQRFFLTPRMSTIDLDSIGSRVWILIDGRRTVMEIAASVEDTFGNEAYPIYERLTDYMDILKENKIVRYTKSGWSIM